MNNKLMKKMIFLLHMPKNNKDLFHECNHLFSKHKHDYEHHEYHTNKRWVIHNLSQQEMGNPWFFENFP
jgi:hypothetical protein